jgi:hypothetical protein
MWDRTSGRQLHAWTVPGFVRSISCKDGLVAVCSENCGGERAGGGVRVFSAASGAPLCSMNGNFTALAWVGERLATLHAERVVVAEADSDDDERERGRAYLSLHQIEVESGLQPAATCQCVARHEIHRCTAEENSEDPWPMSGTEARVLATDGCRVATAWDGVIRVWSIELVAAAHLPMARERSESSRCILHEDQAIEECFLNLFEDTLSVALDGTLLACAECGGGHVRGLSAEGTLRAWECRPPGSSDCEASEIADYQCELRRRGYVIPYHTSLALCNGLLYASVKLVHQTQSTSFDHDENIIIIADAQTSCILREISADRHLGHLDCYLEYFGSHMSSLGHSILCAGTPYWCDDRDVDEARLEGDGYFGILVVLELAGSW